MLPTKNWYFDFKNRKVTSVQLYGRATNRTKKKHKKLNHRWYSANWLLLLLVVSVFVCASTCYVSKAAAHSSAFIGIDWANIYCFALFEMNICQSWPWQARSNRNRSNMSPPVMTLAYWWLKHPIRFCCKIIFRWKMTLNANIPANTIHQSSMSLKYILW